MRPRRFSLLSSFHSKMLSFLPLLFFVLLLFLPLFLLPRCISALVSFCQLLGRATRDVGHIARYAYQITRVGLNFRKTCCLSMRYFVNDNYYFVIHCHIRTLSFIRVKKSNKSRKHDYLVRPSVMCHVTRECVRSSVRPSVGNVPPHETVCLQT